MILPCSLDQQRTCIRAKLLKFCSLSYGSHEGASKLGQAIALQARNTAGQATALPKSQQRLLAHVVSDLLMRCGSEGLQEPWEQGIAAEKKAVNGLVFPVAIQVPS